MPDTPPDTKLAEVADLLRRYRREKGITYDQLAERAHLNSRSHAKALLDSDNPSLQTLLRLAHALKLELRLSVPRTSGAHRVVLINHAGGVGKTTLVRDIGAQLARYGQRVLLIDVDPQHNLTEWLDIDWTAVRREDTILHAVGAYFGNDDERPSLPEPRPVPGFDGYTLDIIPSGDEMMRLDSEIQAQMGPGLYRLRQALDELETRHTYDFILIDSPPYFSAITTLCLNATNNVVIPASTDLKGITAIRRVINYIAGVRNTSNPDLTIRLIVPTKYQPNTVSGQEGLKAMRSIADDVAPVATPARHGVAYNEAQALHAPIPMLNDRNARAVQPDLRAITEELLDAFHVTIDVDVPAEAARER